MPHAITSSDRRTSPAKGATAWTHAAVLVGTLALIVWGALAFGAVYPWAYRPLLAGCAIVGAGAWWLSSRPRGADANLRGLFVCLCLVIGGALLQLVPLDPALRQTLSPASEAYLQSTDVAYSAAQALRERGNAALAGTIASPKRPLTIDPAGTWRGILFGAAFTVLLAGLTRFYAGASVGMLSGSIVVFGVLLALIGIVQKAVLGDHAFGGMLIYGFWRPRYLLSTPFGPYINKNHFAGWMVMALPLAIGYFLALAEVALRRVRRDWRSRLLWLSSSQGGRLQLVVFAIVVMGVSLAMTMSRSGIGCFAVAIAIAAAFASRSGYSIGARLVVLAALAALLIVPLSWAAVDLSGRFTTDGGSLQLRKDAWQATLRIVRDYPLAGTGLNSYGKATLQYRPDRETQHFQEAHNDYLQLLAEGGLLLTLPAVGAMVFLGRTIRQRFRRNRDDRIGYWLRFGATTGLVAIALQSLVEFSLQMPGNAVLFVVLCAIALHHPAEAEWQPFKGPSPSR